jgi:hypothetical protein
MDEVYDMYYENKLSTEIVDLLAESEFMSEEVFNKKVSRVLTLDHLARRYPSTGPDGNPQHIFPPDLEKNF